MMEMDETMKLLYGGRGPKNFSHNRKLKRFLYEQRRKEAIYIAPYPQWIVEEFLYSKFLENDLAVDYKEWKELDAK